MINNNQINLQVLFIPPKFDLELFLSYRFFSRQGTFNENTSISDLTKVIHFYLLANEQLKIKILGEDAKPFSIILHHLLEKKIPFDLTCFFLLFNIEYINTSNLKFPILEPINPQHTFKEAKISEGSVIICEIINSSLFFSSPKQEIQDVSQHISDNLFDTNLVESYSHIQTQNLKSASQQYHNLPKQFLGKDQIRSMTGNISCVRKSKQTEETKIIKNSIYNIPIGLKNLNNTCYINSTIQCLLCCNKLTDYFLSDKYKSDFIINRNSNNSVIEKYAELVKDINQKSDFSIFNPNLFVQCIKSNLKDFENENQHDMEEFLSALITNFMENLDENSSLVHSLFKGKLKNYLTCVKCNKMKTKNDLFRFLYFPLDNSTHNFISLYFYQNAEKARPLQIDLQILSGVSIRKLVTEIASKLVIPLDAFAICVYGNKNYYYINEESPEFNKQLESKDRLCFILLDPKLYNIEQLFKEKSKIEPISHSGDIKQDITKANEQGKSKSKSKAIKEKKIKLIFYHHESLSSNNEITQFIDYNPDLLEISIDSTIANLFQYLTNYYSPILKNGTKNLSIKNTMLPRNFDESQVDKDFKIFFESIQTTTDNNNGFHSFNQFELPCKNLRFEKFINQLIPNNENKYKIDYSILKLTFKIVWNQKFIKRLIKMNTPINLEFSLLNFSIPLDECFSLFFNEQSLTHDNEIFCNQCKKFQQMKVKSEIQKMPEILVLHFKRNQNNGSKVDTFISFPLRDLNIAKYLSYDCENKNNSLYDLFALGYHSGTDGAGHYYACVKKSNDQWYKISDATIEPLKEENIVTHEAYLLFYKKKT